MEEFSFQIQPVLNSKFNSTIFFKEYLLKNQN